MNSFSSFLHLTDLHFGGNFPWSRTTLNSKALQWVENCIQKFKPDFLVITGDITQRGRPLEFEASNAWFKSFNIPTVIIPGNHDITVYWRPIQRLFYPLDEFKACFGEKIIFQKSLSPFHFYSLTTVHPVTLNKGWINSADWEEFLKLNPQNPEKGWKILLTHHPIFPESNPSKSDYVLNYPDYLEKLLTWGFKLFLSGHLHRPHQTLFSFRGQRGFNSTSASSTSNRYRNGFSNKNMAGFFFLRSQVGQSDKLFLQNLIFDSESGKESEEIEKGIELSPPFFL